MIFAYRSNVNGGTTESNSNVTSGNSSNSGAFRSILAFKDLWIGSWTIAPSSNLEGRRGELLEVRFESFQTYIMYSRQQASYVADEMVIRRRENV